MLRHAIGAAVLALVFASADPAAAFRGYVGVGNAAAGAALLAAAGLLVHGSPCTPLGFALGARRSELAALDLITHAEADQAAQDTLKRRGVSTDCSGKLRRGAVARTCRAGTHG